MFSKVNDNAEDVGARSTTILHIFLASLPSWMLRSIMPDGSGDDGSRHDNDGVGSDDDNAGGPDIISYHRKKHSNKLAISQTSRIFIILLQL